MPIVRHGAIAAMPGEPLYDRKTGLSFRGYLLEVRSTGGLSGSPVVAYLGYDRDAAGHNKMQSSPDEAPAPTPDCFGCLRCLP